MINHQSNRKRHKISANKKKGINYTSYKYIFPP